jgi:hypothetical protein
MTSWLRTLAKDTNKRPTAERLLEMRVLHRHADGDQFVYRELSALEMAREETSFFTSHDDPEGSSQGSYVDADEAFIYPAVLCSPRSGDTPNRDLAPQMPQQTSPMPIVIYQI